MILWRSSEIVWRGLGWDSIVVALGVGRLGLGWEGWGGGLCGACGWMGVS